MIGIVIIDLVCHVEVPFPATGTYRTNVSVDIPRRRRENVGLWQPYTKAV